MAVLSTFISTFFTFLFLLQIATAGPRCARVYGSNIKYADCISALAIFNARVWIDIAGGSSAVPFMLSRDPRLATGMRQMPLKITQGTCGIALDMTDPLPVPGQSLCSWRNFQRHIGTVLRACVTQPGAIGGVYKVGAFEVTIVNPHEEAVRNVFAMSQTALSLSTAIRTESMDLKLKQDAETDISSTRGSHTPPHAAPPFPPQLAPTMQLPIGYPYPLAPNMHRPALRPPYAFPQAPNQARPNAAPGSRNPSQEAHQAHQANLHELFRQNLQLHGNLPSAQDPGLPPPGRSATPFQGQSRGPRPPFQWRAPSVRSAGAPVMEQYLPRPPPPPDKAFGDSGL